MEDLQHLYDHLDALETRVVDLEGAEDTPDAASTAIHKLFQSAHNLKSGLAMAGLERAAGVLHHLEDGLDAMRRGRASWSVEWADALLETVDKVRNCLDHGGDDELQAPQLPMIEVSTPHRRWQEILTSPQTAQAEAALAQGLGLYRIEKLFNPGLSRDVFENLLILEDIRAVGTLVAIQPDYDQYAQVTHDLAIQFYFSSTQEFAELEKIFFDPLLTLRPPRAPIRILVVEDDPAQTHLLEQILTPYGPCRFVADGGSALIEFKQHLESQTPFDIVILDLNMPVMNGQETLHAMRDWEAECGIYGLDCCLIFMNSIEHELETVKTSFRHQADGYFIKPYSFQELKKRLEEILAGLQNKRERRAG